MSNATEALRRVKDIVLQADYPNGHVVTADNLSLADLETVVELAESATRTNPDGLREALEEAREALKPFAIKPDDEGWYDVPTPEHFQPAIDALTKLEAALASLPPGGE